MYPERSELSDDMTDAERLLGSSRRYMLVAVSSMPLAHAYASVEHEGQWYGIFEDDEISIKTLALINQFNTIQAIPSTSPALTPTISVGARQ